MDSRASRFGGSKTPPHPVSRSLVYGPPGPPGPQGPQGAPGAVQVDESAVSITRDAQGRIAAVLRESGKSVLINRDEGGTMTGFVRDGRPFSIVRNPAGQIVRVEPAA